MGDETETTEDEAVVSEVREEAPAAPPAAQKPDSGSDPVSRRASDIDELVSTVDGIRGRMGVFETFMKNVQRWAKGAGRNV